MTALETALRGVGRDLTEAGIAFALVGGLAVSIRSEPRFTRDADLAVAVATDAEAEALVRRLRSLNYSLQSVVEQQAVGRLGTARLAPPGDAHGPVLDLLFASSGIEAEVIDEAEPLEVLPGLVIPVARTGHLIALKLLSRDDERRPQDLVDLRTLLAIASSGDIARARHAVTLIGRRGFHRGRDLEAALQALLASGGGRR